MIHGAGKTAQWVRHLLQKPDDLGSIPGAGCKRPDVIVHSCEPVTPDKMGDRVRRKAGSSRASSPGVPCTVAETRRTLTS